MPTKSNPLVLAALRAEMGDWTYYISMMKFADVAHRISIVQDIHTSHSLQELLQRQLTARSKTIRDYLLNQPQRFFNALVVATYGGQSTWNELSVQDGPAGLLAPPPDLEGVLGFLSFDETVKLFAVDGQHRVVGIRQALARDAGLALQEVCAIFVPGVIQQHRQDDPDGFERTRRLFSTLNRYAKPVNKRDIIALDEDDVVAIIARNMVEEYPLFRDKVSAKQSKAIPTSDRGSFTNIITIYDVLDVILRTPRWSEVKRFRPDDANLSLFSERAREFWDLMIRNFEPLQFVAGAEARPNLVEQYRGPEGGHLLFRPVGLNIVTKAISLLRDQSVRLDESIRRCALAPMNLAEIPWARLLWDPANGRMITTGENQRVALRILFHIVGGDLQRLNTDATELRAEWAGILGRNVEEVALPTVVA